MTDRQILILQDSWKQFLKTDSQLVGDVFYSRLFLLMPSLRHLFKNSMTDQYAKIVDMLSLIVSKLDKLDELSEDIKQLAIRHEEYGVRPGHYKLVGDALLWTLAKGLGKNWTEELAQAWFICYTFLADTMILAGGSTRKAIN